MGGHGQDVEDVAELDTHSVEDGHGSTANRIH